MARKKKRTVTAVTSGAITILIVVLVIAGISWVMGEGDSSSGSGDKTQQCVQDDITASVQTDGSLHVVDARTYQFSGQWSLTAAVLDPPDDGSVSVNGVSVTDSSGTTTALTEVPFQTSWRTSGGPTSGHYAIDTTQNTIYAFSSTNNATKTFTFDYVYSNAVTQYDDVSVLYWQFVGKNWDVNTQNVTAHLTLPVPAGQNVAGGENVYAFGHGALDGSVSFASDGTIDFAVSKVKSGSFAEMRVAFPCEWTPGIAASQVRTGNGLQGVLDEEQTWQQEAQLQRLLSALMLIIPLLVSVACVIVSIVMFIRHGKEYTPQFQDDYWRDVPEKGINPAVVGRITRWNEEDANDLTATLMHLSNLGVMSIDSVTEVVDRAILPDKQVETYRLTLHSEKLDELQLDAIDTAAVELVFGRIGNDAQSVTLKDIETYADQHAESYVNGVKGWQNAIDDQVNARGFFEDKGNMLKGAFIVVAVLLIAGGLFLSSLFTNFSVFLGLLPGALTLLAFSFFMTRRSRDAVEIEAKSKALEHWFKDFTALDEAIPTDAKVWGELLVYAYIFGVADQVVENLNRTMPGLWNDPYFAGSWMWYYNPYGGVYAGAASGDFFGQAFENTFQSANAAISAASGGGGGLFGGGGGFSGGGGGGFGGGGGGFSR